ncbi:hypothetical protein [Hydrogenophaga sp. NFH-34]|uniref:hypothetical protein n=1 Tax=Hydrogenophaga sp. NFH-34 TaxID=2744446 RepID=UPI001F303219|nr:hypothetical protein [Hydrogenophaga sp. NFH-34]
MSVGIFNTAEAMDSMGDAVKWPGVFMTGLSPRLVWLRCLWAVLVLGALSACMAPAYVATKIENLGNDRALTKGTDRLQQYIAKLQAEGDPQGDYYYALGNSDGWIEDVKDPKAITQLFEQAAAKGSMDARILLALQEAMGQEKPGELRFALSPREDLQGWAPGLAKLLPLLNEQCYARRLVIDAGRPKVDHYSIAYKVWPHFRDGYYRRNADGTRTLLKDAERQKLWEDLDEQCPSRMPQRMFLNEDLEMVLGVSGMGF